MRNTYTKPLQQAEVRRKCVCVLKEGRHLFPGEGSILDLQDSKTGRVYQATVGSQYRVSMVRWYEAHPEVKPGDEIVFRKRNGAFVVTVAQNGKEPPESAAAAKLRDIANQSLSLALDLEEIANSLVR